MTINEFRWGVRPSIPGHWQGTTKHNVFEVEIAADWIEARAEDDGDIDSQRVRAAAIVEGIVRKIGLEEKSRFIATFGSLSRFDPQANRRDINVFLSDTLGVKASAHADVVVTAVDGTVIADSRADRVTEVFRFADDVANNETLRKMIDYLLEYHDDAQRKLAPLFDIIELASEVFGHPHKAATALGIDVQRMKDATNLMNDSSIRTARHRGQELGSQRDPTLDEIARCEGVADKIVSEYTKLVRRGTAPK